MWDNLKDLIASWDIAYSPFTDLLQVRDPRVMGIDNQDIVTEDRGNATVAFEKQEHTPLMIQLSRAYECIGEIEDIPKEEMFGNLIEYLKVHYGSTEK